MENKHYSRKQRQLKYLVKQLNNLLQKTDDNLKSEIKKMTTKIKCLVSQLNGIVSTNRMKRILGTVALFIGISFTNTASAQYFTYPVTNPFGITPGYTNMIQSVNLIDIDNDGDLDLFTDSLTYAGYYSLATNFNYQENIGTATNPNFKSPELNPFNLTLPTADSSMVKLRQFIDLDNDGDFDILSNVIYPGYNGFSSVFRYYENTGTPSSPTFITPVSNPFGLQGSSSDVQLSSIGDIDNDGDYDLINMLVSYNGSSWEFIENVGSSANPMFSIPQGNVMSLPSTYGLVLPTLVDLDSDGDLDMIFGQESYSAGEFRYCENTGSASSALFSPPIINPNGLNGSMFYSGPTIELKDLDGDGDLDVLAGTYEETFYFENVGVQQPVTYECINYSCIDPGTGVGSYATLSACQTNCTAPVSYDCDWSSSNCYDPGDGDGYYTTYADCMLDCTPQPTWDCVGPGNCQDPGNGSGSFWSLQNCQAICLSTSIGNTELSNLKLYPNPVNNTLNVSSEKKIKKIEIYDALGRIIYTENNPSSTISVEQFEAGLYSIAIIFDDNRIVKKFTK